MTVEPAMPATYPAPPIELPPGYYLENFKRLLDTVAHLYADLLNPEEEDFLSSFAGLSAGAQKLYVRLLSRVGPSFREGELRYPEVDDIAASVTELLASGFFQSVEQLSVAELGRLYRKGELEQIYSEQLPVQRGRRKAELLVSIEGLDHAEDECFALCQQWSSERILLPGYQDRMLVFRLLFFGNQHQDFTDFVLSDLGVNRFYPYNLDPGERLFESRDTLDEYLALIEFRERYASVLESQDRGEMLGLALDLGAVERSGVLASRWYRLNNRVARQLERWQEHTAALQLYSSTPDHPARERSARIRYLQGEYQMSEDICVQIVEVPANEAELEFAMGFLPRVQRKLGQEVVTVARDDFDTQKLCVSPHERGVEMAVAAAYSDAGDATYFVENGLMNGLFGLAFWEQIFARVPGVFVNPFQFAPLDMHSGEFYSRRQQAVDRRIEQLRQLSAGELFAAYDRFYGYANSWVNWQLLTRPMLELVVLNIPLENLEAIWRRILFDPQSNRSGFPDLVQFPAVGGYELIEVKGPGDTLQKNQKRWLRYFKEHNVPARVVHVSWAD
jgi:hypothetical protein